MFNFKKLCMSRTGPTSFTGLSDTPDMLIADNFLQVDSIGEELILIDTLPPDISWVEVTGTTQQAEVNTGYITNNASLVTITLPVSAEQGDIIEIAGKGVGGWKLAQNAGQTVYYGKNQSTSGVTGNYVSVHYQDVIKLLCRTDNTEWEVISGIGRVTKT